MSIDKNIMKEQVLNIDKIIQILDCIGGVHQCFVRFVLADKMFHNNITIGIDFFFIVLNQECFVLTGSRLIDQVTRVFIISSPGRVGNKEYSGSILTFRYSVGASNIRPSVVCIIIDAIVISVT